MGLALRLDLVDKWEVVGIEGWAPCWNHRRLPATVELRQEGGLGGTRLGGGWRAGNKYIPKTSEAKTGLGFVGGRTEDPGH